MIDINEDICLRAKELIDISCFEGITFGFAESLTGGSISSAVVNIPGASNAFKDLLSHIQMRSRKMYWVFLLN